MPKKLPHSPMEHGVAERMPKRPEIDAVPRAARGVLHNVDVGEGTSHQGPRDRRS